MKKLISFLIVVLVAAGAAVWVFQGEQVLSVFGFEQRVRTFSLPGEVASLSLEANPEITVPITIYDQEQIAVMAELLENAQRTQPPDEEHILRLDGTVSGVSWLLRLDLSTADAAYTYNVYNAGHILLLDDLTNWYILDWDDFFALITGFDGFYRYRELAGSLLILEPVQPVSTPIPVVYSNFAHLGIDGNFILVPAPEIEVLSIEWDDNRLPEIEFLLQLQSVHTVILNVQGGELFRGSLEEASNFPLISNSDYEIRMIAQFESANYAGTVHFQYFLETTAFPVDFEISGNVTDLGEALILRVHNMPEGELVQSTTSLPVSPTFYPDGQGGMISLLPVSIFTSPGEHFVELHVGNTYERFPITVLSTQFETQRMTADPAVTAQTLHSIRANEEFRNVIHPLRYISDDIRHWEGRFTQPVDVESGRITTPFAVFRYVNGVPTSRHAAIDIALPQGTPIYAPAAGRVIFAGYLQLTGYTILIEHGFGLKTWYYHMVSINVATNDMVQIGDKIAEVGSTGFSTGPHLHYGMSVYSTFINPNTAKNTDLFNFL